MITRLWRLKVRRGQADRDRSRPQSPMGPRRAMIRHCSPRVKRAAQKQGLWKTREAQAPHRAARIGARSWSALVPGGSKDRKV